MNTNCYFSKTHAPHVPAWLRQLNRPRTRHTGLPALGEAIRKLDVISWMARLLPEKVIPSDLGAFEAYNPETGVRHHERLSPNDVYHWDRDRRAGGICTCRQPP